MKEPEYELDEILRAAQDGMCENVNRCPDGGCVDCILNASLSEYSKWLENLTTKTNKARGRNE